MPGFFATLRMTNSFVFGRTVEGESQHVLGNIPDSPVLITETHRSESDYATFAVLGMIVLKFINLK